MIKLKKMSNMDIIINCDYIVSIEANPDTVITLSNERKLIVKESPEEIVELTMNYKKKLLNKEIDSR